MQLPDDIKTSIDSLSSIQKHDEDIVMLQYPSSHSYQPADYYMEELLRSQDAQLHEPRFYQDEKNFQLHRQTSEFKYPRMKEQFDVDLKNLIPPQMPNIPPPPLQWHA